MQIFYSINSITKNGLVNIPLHFYIFDVLFQGCYFFIIVSPFAYYLLFYNYTSVVLFLKYLNSFLHLYDFSLEKNVYTCACYHFCNVESVYVYMYNF